MEHPSFTELRKRAEEKVASSPPGSEQKGNHAAYVHELEVRQIELEMQAEELRAARHELEASLSRYAHLFDFAPIGYVVVDEREIIREANHAAARLFGMPRARLSKRRLSHLVEPSARRDVCRLVSGVLATPCSEDAPARTCEAALQGEGGAPLAVRLTAVGLAGAEPLAMIALQDITAIKRESALREESDRKDDFLGALSHELRNPISAVCNSLAVLGRTPGVDQAGAALGVAQRQMQQLTRIVDDLLDVTRIARGKLSLRRERLDLGTVVRSVVEDHRMQFDEAGVSLETSIARECLWAYADPTRVAQVVGNLVVNALKFTPRGGHVVVGLQREGERAVLHVRDDGAGIAPELRERLFEPFVQAPQTLDRTRGGLGLGLATVKGIVELHVGTVGAVSAGPGRGAEFTVRLPLVTAPEAIVEPPRPESPRAQRRILVVEDNVDSADMLRELLEMHGHTVDVAHEGPSALDKARAFHPEIVFCDIGLPGMDGYAIAGAMRADPGLRKARLVALSGYARPDDLRRARQAGFDRHLPKPIDVAELERVMAELLGPGQA